MNILIADDSEDIRFLLQIYCKGTEYRLTFSEDGARAIAAYESDHYDLIVMDVQMPGMDGLTATRQIRTIESARGSKRIPILALTGNSTQQDLTEALAAGYDALLSKPIPKQVFLSAIEQSLPGSPAICIPEGLEELACQYLAKCRRDVSKFQELSKCAAFEEARRFGHQLKGSGSSYGFPDLTRLGAEIEKFSSDKNLSDLSVQFAEVSAYLETAHRRLENFVPAAH